MSTLAELLRSIPAKYRRLLNWLYALVVAATAILTLAGYEIPVNNWEQILLLVGGYLGVQSAVNVSTTTDDTVREFYRLAAKEPKVDVPAPPPDQYRTPPPADPLDPTNRPVDFG